MTREARPGPRRRQAPEDDSRVLRLDVWLDVACVFKTRSEAQRACKGGKVFLNGHRGKPHQEIHIGDKLEITMSGGRKKHLSVTGLAGTHLPKAQARELYDDVTPPPTAEEQELRDLLRRAGPVPGSPMRRRAAPDPDHKHAQRARRVLRRLKRDY